jgi:hypothetical protein
MIMRVKLDCPSIVADIFAAVGAFIGNDRGLSTILRVETFSLQAETFGAVVSWDIHPDSEQIAEFRRVWDEKTGLRATTIVHDAPSSIVDKPNFAAWN